MEDSRSSVPVIVEDTGEEERVSLFTRIGTFFSGCWGKITSFSKSVFSGRVFSGTWNVLCKIPSYCVIRWDVEEEEETDGRQQTADGSRVPVKVTAPGVAAAPPKVGYDAPGYDADEDELEPSRWWNLGIKTAAVAVAALILAGGYFAVKPLLFDGTAEVATVEMEEETDLEDIASVTTPSSAADPQSAESAAADSGIPNDSRTSGTEHRTQLSGGQSPPQDEPLAQVAPPTPPVAAAPAAADPFAAASPPAAPPGAAPFAAIPVVAEQPAPAADPHTSDTANANTVNANTTNANTIDTTANILESELPPALTALQPLAPLEPAAGQPQLQPLVALNASTFPSATVDAGLPAPVLAAASAPIASNHRPQRNAAFTAPPTPPAVNVLTQTPVQPTIALVEPIQEVVPSIPSGGTIQNVPPPVQMPAVVETPVQNRFPNESAPAIPRDAPITAEVPPVVVTPVPAVAAAVPATATPATATPTTTLPATENTPRIVPLDTQPLDWELWEQVRAIQNDTNDTRRTPSRLRFDNTVAASEPALRFTPRETATPVSENSADSAAVENPLLDDAMSQFSALMPTGEVNPNAGNAESFLPVMENAPQPVYAEPSPAYRDAPYGDTQVADRSITFQRRIDSEISRSPSTTETYIVQEGDTYMTISDRFYGTSLLYTALAQHNQKLGIGWRPTVGVVIEIPTAEFLRLNYRTSPHQERQLDAVQHGMRYIVQEGDTVFRLATDRLRDSTRWREIYALNADRIQDVRELQPGMEILLPL